MTDPESNEEADNGDALATGEDRFLARSISQALQMKHRIADDLVRHFPPAAMMAALEEQPLVRARILEATTGIRFKIAQNKSASSAGDDLQIALDVGETTSNVVLQQLPPNDCVRYLDRKKLWAFLTESRFWDPPTTTAEQLRSVRMYLAFLIDCALSEGLIRPGDVIAGIQLERFAQALTKEELGQVLGRGLEGGRSGTQFTEALMLSVAPPSTLVERLPLAYIWDSVIIPKIAAPHGFTDEAPRASSPQPAVEIAAAGPAVEKVNDSVPASGPPRPPTRPSAFTRLRDAKRPRPQGTRQVGVPDDVTFDPEVIEEGSDTKEIQARAGA